MPVSSNPCREEGALEASLDLSALCECLVGGTKDGGRILKTKTKRPPWPLITEIVPRNSSHYAALVVAMQLPKYYFWIYFWPFQHQTTHSENVIEAGISLWTGWACQVCAGNGGYLNTGSLTPHRRARGAWNIKRFCAFVTNIHDPQGIFSACMGNPWLL